MLFERRRGRMVSGSEHRKGNGAYGRGGESPGKVTKEIEV